MSQDFSPRSAIAVRTAVEQSFESLDVLYEKGHLQSFLVVLFSTIDALAWLAADHDGDVTKHDFMNWSERFLLPDSGLECSALDLYAARCGALHSFSAYSQLHRRGKARLLCYAVGDKALPELKAFLARSSERNAVAVQIEMLADAVARGWERFLDSLDSNPRAVERLDVRGGMLFSRVDPQVVRER